MTTTETTGDLDAARESMRTLASVAASPPNDGLLVRLLRALKSDPPEGIPIPMASGNAIGPHARPRSLYHRLRAALSPRWGVRRGLREMIRVTAGVTAYELIFRVNDGDERDANDGARVKLAAELHALAERLG